MSRRRSAWGPDGLQPKGEAVTTAAEPLRYCQHATCRGHAIAELTWMGEALKRHDLLQAAGDVYFATVRCRRQPRKGPIHAPFAVSTQGGNS